MEMRFGILMVENAETAEVQFTDFCGEDFTIALRRDPEGYPYLEGFGNYFNLNGPDKARGMRIAESMLM